MGASGGGETVSDMDRDEVVLMADQAYVLTEAHKAQLPAHRDRWVRNALSTAPTTAAEWQQMVEAVERLYRAARVPPPPRERIVLVSSPLVAGFAGVYASVWWQKVPRVPLAALEEDGATTTEIETRRAVRAATLGVASGSGLMQPRESYPVPVGPPAWCSGQEGCRAAVTVLGPHAQAGREACTKYYQMWNGGNQWSGYVAYLSFFRHVVQCPLDDTAWDAYETLAAMGPRMVHEQFCLISERPVHLTVDAEHRPHNETGPYCRWRDGSALYAWHGVYVAADVIEHPERLTVADIRAEPNDEIRRIKVARMGEARFIREGGGEQVHEDAFGVLYRMASGHDDDVLVVRLENSTPEPDGSRRVFWRYVHPELRPMRAGRLGDRQTLTAHNAVASTFGLRGEEYWPERES